MMNIENISISHLCGKLTFSTKSLINDSHILPKFTVLQGAGKTAKESVVLEEDQVSTTHHHSWSLQVDSDVSSVGALGFDHVVTSQIYSSCPETLTRVLT